MKLMERIKSRLVHGAHVSTLKDKTPVEKGLAWLKAYRVKNNKVVPSYTFQRRPMATQEETGYILGILNMYGEKSMARQMAKWLAKIQQPDGSSAAMDGVPYTFDTAQVVRGFLSVLDDLPELEGNLRRACDFIVSQIDDQGVIHTPSYETWKLPDGSILHEYGNLYILPPLKFAGERLSEPKYLKACQRAVDNYKRKSDLVEFKPQLAMLSHYFGYMMEALVDLGEIDLAKKGLTQAQKIQRNDGAIPAYPGVEWVCSTGMAQLALAWYKLGTKEPANKVLDYLATIQNPSGGFFGSYGQGAQYFPYQEISWATKFFLEAHYWKKKINV
jgi:malonyl-CoA O-methyltransferase